jgi:hypothetical protein
VNPTRHGWFDSAWRVTAVYTFVTLATTWPLITRVTTSLPADLGDPLLNSFILQWGVDHLRALLGGDIGAFRSYWHAPIFHPEPLALAYSEHLIAQALQVAPIHAATGNILLSYNLLFLSTFVLSGLGMYLLSRELTGSAPAAVVAGLLYGFALYRVAHYPHLQVLSSQWLPFALFGLRRFFTTRRLAPLAGATLALIAQNLSNGYYLMFFAPFVVAYCLYEIADRGLWGDTRVLAGLAGAGLVTVIATMPFLVPYLLLRNAGFAPRSLGEVREYSADVLAWVTAPSMSRVWGWFETLDRPEGQLFPGAVVLVLASLGVAARARTLWRVSPPALGQWQQRTAMAALAAAVVVLGLMLVVMVTNDHYWRLFGVLVTVRSPWRSVGLAGLLLTTVIALSPRARTLARGVPGSALGFFAAGAVVSVLLTLGPVPTLGGRPTSLPAPYAVLYQYVPGFDGLRVPARYAMVTAACLAVLGGFGARAVLARRWGQRAVTLLSVLFLLETAATPIVLDEPLGAAPYRATPLRVFTGEAVPPVYRFAATLPPSAVLLELPIGSGPWDLQSVFYQPVHGHPLVNGYSGGFPLSFNMNRAALNSLEERPDLAWQRLQHAGATHVIVHGAAFRRAEADIIERWLTSRGATQVAVFGVDRVFAVPR